MTGKSVLVVIIIVAGLAGTAFAGSNDVIVHDPWSRASIGTSRPGVAYMTIRNEGSETVTLVGIGTDLALMSEIHKSSTNAQGVSSMVLVGEIEIPPASAVVLEPGGLHAMLMGLQEPMLEGDSFSLTLIFRDGGELTVAVPILRISAQGPQN